MTALNNVDFKEFFENSVILSPTKKGNCGIDNLNKEIQNRFNKNISLNYGNILFKLDDRVMQISNDYEKEWERSGYVGMGIFNGETGIVTKLDKVGRNIIVKFDDDKIAEYSFKDLRQFNACICNDSS